MVKPNGAYVFFIICVFLSVSNNTLARCQNVPESIVNILEDGLTVDSGKLSKDTAQVVASKDFQNIYFIAAEIDGKGMEGSGDIGLWAANSLEVGKGMILSVNTTALKFSNWLSGRKSQLRLSKKHDGARKSISCAKKLSNSNK